MPRQSIVRHAQDAVEAGLSDTRVVVILGARQVGKSTLLEQVVAAEEGRRRILTFDDQPTRAAAIADPAGFVADLDTPVALDEVQRVPAIMTEIKLRVDRDRAAGQFLLTGSANLLEMTRVKDSLAGRAEYLRLHPFSQGELGGQQETFVPNLFAGEFPVISDARAGRKAYAPILARGGYPEMQTRRSDRRFPWFESYLEGIMDRDLTTLSEVAERTNVISLLRAIAAISGNELVIEKLSSAHAIPGTTVRRHTALLETLFLTRQFPAWSANLLSRTIRKPKVYITDTGLLAFLVGADESRLETDLDIGGIFYETFVATELQRQIAWQTQRPRLFHFRDQKQREVDIVMERNDGSVVGVEVKPAASINRRDFRGLTHLRNKLGDRFKAGALLYTGANTVPFGDRLAAVPLSGLWS